MVECPWCGNRHEATRSDAKCETCDLFRRAGLDLHVDHVIPLQGENVSGLHVENNLQLLSRLENISKKNRFIEARA